MILVVGATGDVGGAICRRLLEAGHEVTILVRPGSAYESLVDAGARPVTGDLKDPVSLAVACTGVDTVMTTANSAKRSGADHVESVDRQGNRNLVDAARDARASTFIFVSILGADPDSPNPFVRAKAETEQAIQGSGMRYTILRPNIFIDVWAPVVVGIPLQSGRPVRLVGQGDHRHSFIFSGDVAAFAVAALGHPDAADRILTIGGPEPLTWRDIVARVERVTGAPIATEFVGPDDEMPGLPPFVGALLPMQETYESPIEMDELARRYGVRLTPFDEVARRVFGAPPPS